MQEWSYDTRHRTRIVPSGRIAIKTVDDLKCNYIWFIKVDNDRILGTHCSADD